MQLRLVSASFIAPINPVIEKEPAHGNMVITPEKDVSCRCLVGSDGAADFVQYVPRKLNK